MKNIIITGASRGIGSELAKYLCITGRVLLLSRDIEQLEQLRYENPALLIEKIDLAEKNSKKNIATAISKHFKTVDILINNAGYLVSKPVLNFTTEDIQKSFATNVMGLIETCQTVIPLMQKKGGHIVNIGSMGGFQGSVKFPGLSVYSSTKAAVAGFSECLAEELRETKIKVNCLALGAAQTEMLSKAFSDYKAPVSAKKMAEFIAEFALHQHQWINGKTIPVALSTP